MVKIIATGADERLLDLGSNPTIGNCLQVADQVILQGAPVLRHATTALVEWGQTPATAKHADTDAPSGFPVYFSGAAGQGDVAISDGNGGCVGIDTKNGVYKAHSIGRQTLAQRARQMGGKYLGWSSNFLGYQLITGTSTAGTGTTTVPVPVPTPVKEISMRVITYTGIPPQAPPYGPYNPADPNTGGSYYILADEAGWVKPLTATQGQIQELVKFLARDPEYFPNGPMNACLCSSKAQFDWFMNAMTPPAAPAPGGAPTGLSGVLAALAALDKQGDDYQTVLVALLDGMPAAVRAKIVAAP